ncbi:hypothetical protein G3N59_25460 [Paraburkholderia sp. Ac-20340]|uniref:hypothetical protein n=1 Tax=Paraburkholderia sp. Ac-20340 TaxID=2703888 RepID=UPI00197CCD51|nr:hypothetical protein [Paraburkholderia sp. Ac-20340]MBN3856733.1 hypothetical protein [Paraburkholderia sp. Ac-20340]
MEQTLLIRLMPQEQEALGTPFITSVDQADRTLKFWADYLKLDASNLEYNVVHNGMHGYVSKLLDDF